MNAAYRPYDFDYASAPTSTPYYIIDRALLRKNMRLLKRVQDEADCRILLALKAFSTWGFFDEMESFLAGFAASSLNEARLGCEKFNVNGTKDAHVYSPAYSADELRGLCKYCNHIVFNSLEQFRKFRPIIEDADHKIQVGLRVNPEYSEVALEIYNPCTSRSRFGVRLDVLLEAGEDALDGIDGFHFHTMCQQGADVLQRTLKVVCERFERFFPRLSWINFGGGHHITREGYNVERLIQLVRDFRKRYGLKVFLEPGEAHVFRSGFLVATVLDVVKNSHGLDVGIVDASATAHMPDVLEMPYVPEIVGARVAVEDPETPLEEGFYKYLLGCKTCLSGDVIGEYQFLRPLQIGDRLVFEDMAQYTVCKNTTFNGVPLPSIVSCDSEKPGGDFRVLRQFQYEDFETRLS